MSTNFCPICKADCTDGFMPGDSHPCRFFHGKSCMVNDLLAELYNNLNFKDLGALIEKANRWMDSPA